jgi:uncharacterized membrane protein YphA (DoxX/SURF4 family)
LPEIVGMGGSEEEEGADGWGPPISGERVRTLGTVSVAGEMGRGLFLLLGLNESPGPFILFLFLLFIFSVFDFFHNLFIWIPNEFKPISIFF